MTEEKDSQPGPPFVAVDPVKEKTLFDAFASQAASAALWPEAVKPHLPKKPD